MLWILTLAVTLPFGQVTFDDVTSAAGLSYTHWDPVTTPEWQCDEAPRLVAGAAAGDFDGDGWVDLYVTRLLEPNLLFKNLGGSFVDVAASAGVDLVDESTGCAWGDIDNDGDLDLYVGAMTNGGRNYLYINDGTGFIEVAMIRGVALPCADCRHNIMSVAFGDHDLDGDLDILTTEWHSSDPFNTLNRLLQNPGNGVFQDVTAAVGATMNGAYGFSGGFADVSDDGWPDLLIAADFNTSRLLTSTGGGYFTDTTMASGVGTDENGMGSAIGDIDNDGDLDWFVTSIYDANNTCETAACGWDYSGNRLYVNQGSGVFIDGTDAAGVRDGGWGWGASFFDYDNDGDLDLGMTNGVVFSCTAAEDVYNTDVVRLWDNDGTGVMTDVSAAAQFTDTGSGKGFVVFDYDADGDQDVFITNNAGSPVLYRNNGGNANAWLDVRLSGTQSQRQGVGARVTAQVAAGGTVQHRDMHCNNNFMSQNETVAHFGLGAGVSAVHELTVTWPVSGLVQVCNDVPANQRLNVVEAVYGDLDGSFSVNLIDITTTVNAFQGNGANPDPAPCGGDGLTNLDDVLAVIDANAGRPLCSPCDP
jgi:hypothetical protein